MGTFLVGLVVFGLAALVCRSLWRQHKNASTTGAAFCGGACGGCSGCSLKKSSLK